MHFESGPQDLGRLARFFDPRVFNQPKAKRIIPGLAVLFLLIRAGLDPVGPIGPGGVAHARDGSDSPVNDPQRTRRPRSPAGLRNSQASLAVAR